MAETEYRKGDIICAERTQQFLRLVIHVDEEEKTIWCQGLVLMGLMGKRGLYPDPFPIYLDDPDAENLVVLGNLEDFTRLADEYEERLLEKGEVK